MGLTQTTQVVRMPTDGELRTNLPYTFCPEGTRRIKPYQVVPGLLSESGRRLFQQSEFTKSVSYIADHGNPVLREAGMFGSLPPSVAKELGKMYDSGMLFTNDETPITSLSSKEPFYQTKLREIDDLWKRLKEDLHGPHIRSVELAAKDLNHVLEEGKFNPI